jgi:flagellar basal body-associated protein FliL
MIMLLNSYPFSQLEIAEGKEILREQAEIKVREIIQDEGVESVLFTGFVIQ